MSKKDLRQLPKFRCKDCETTAGCDKHELFRCVTCGKPTPWSDGGADDRPGDCSDCWLAWWTPRAELAAGIAALLEP